MKTIQLRRYRFEPGSLELMLPWWSANVPTLRAAFGFSIEFAYALHESNEFVWAVSFPGSREAFETAEQHYFEAPERMAVYKSVPGDEPAFDVQFVDEQVA